MLFRDRADAGRHLLSKLGAYQDRPDVLVLGLPRGGVIVAELLQRQSRPKVGLFPAPGFGRRPTQEMALLTDGVGQGAGQMSRVDDGIIDWVGRILDQA